MRGDSFGREGEIVAEPIRVQFESGGSTCVGYLYEPQDEVEPRPCVLLCHGFGGTQDTSSIRVAAQTFVGAGFSVLTFDPPELSRETAKRAPRGETIEYPIAHFHVYAPKIREQVLADQVAFLRRHLTDGE